MRFRWQTRTIFCGMAAVTLAALAGCASRTGDAPDDQAEGAVIDPSDSSNAPKPPVMGWNTWNKFHCDISESLILEQADALIASGLRDVGYDTLVLDDCWEGPRDASGRLTSDPEHFPSGMKALGDELHKRGLKFGIYSAAGKVTCQWKPGSFGYETIDAQTFADWGVDFLKHDWCWHAAALEMVGALEPRDLYPVMKDALDSSGRSIVYSVASKGTRGAAKTFRDKYVGVWAPQISDMWRVSGDITNDWKGVTNNIEEQNDWAAVASPGHYNDPDMLEVGNGALTEDESKAHFALWAITGAPLIAGNDLRAMDETTLAILKNTEVIAVDQDARMLQGTRVLEREDGVSVWSKPLSGSGVRAVAVFNGGEEAASIDVAWTTVGLAERPARVRDLWAHAERGRLDSLAVTVPAHGIAMVKVWGAEPAGPSGQTWVSDLPFTYAANYWGLVERDRSVGERGPSDGHQLTVARQTFEKGIGVHAPSDVRIRLGARCSSFDATIGLDDEEWRSGSVSFEVWADDQKAFDSGVMRKGESRPISVTVAGAKELRLVVRAATDDTRFDHADWAAARLTCDPPSSAD